jgi:hypothetical protein
VSHNEKLFKRVDLTVVPDDLSPAGKRAKERIKNLELLKKCDCKKFKKKDLDEMLARGMIRKGPFDRLIWTMQGRLALQRIIDAEKLERDSQGLPWPPSPDYYRKMREL